MVITFIIISVIKLFHLTVVPGLSQLGECENPTDNRTAGFEQRRKLRLNLDIFIFDADFTDFISYFSQ